MMFARIFAVATLAVIAVATPVARGECDTGTIQCCESYETVSIRFSVHFHWFS
jgi:hypothetical protein